jgi:hypothetical protein
MSSQLDAKPIAALHALYYDEVRQLQLQQKVLQSCCTVLGRVKLC